MIILAHVIFISLDGTTSLRFTLTRTRLQTVAITFWDTNKKKSPVRRSEKHTITAPQARRRRRKMVFLGENFDFFYFPPGSLSVWTPSPCLPAGKSPDADAILIWKRPKVYPWDLAKLGVSMVWCIHGSKTLSFTMVSTPP